ncbi:hypothetical protein B0A50_05896 [Salinomyces thailandicus]|uniref:1,3-beta-glucanosyltransferase n=1 Tax=Salinomyces thailandicus TaxID=706561 RepID=A0A4U0TSR2_9PEZI|nr:hypothetical protein B0A50_05896 [Salinomyces thailandica]
MAPFTNILACGLAFAATAAAVNPIVVQEQEFIDSKTNDRFVVIGIDYQPGGQAAVGTGAGDPLSNGTLCLRDAALMQNLGVNTIRSYNLNPTLNHDECASIFNSAGIYMILDVNSPLAGGSIDRSDPSSSYTTDYLTSVFQRIEAFKSYPNTLGFFAGNEIINDVPTGQANPPYIRAVQRDMKNYIAANADRQIPVGYSAADVRSVLEDTWAYLQCDNSANGGDTMSNSDFFGLNSYSWCGGDATFETSGYNDLVSIFSNTTIPVFFSEYGCNQVRPRVFDEVQALYGPKMTVMSGGLLFEWTEEGDDFGLVQTYANGSLQLTTDFENLSDQYAMLDVSSLTSVNDTATSLQAPQCDSSLISGDGFSNDFDIPSPPDGAESLISAGISNPPTGSIISVTQTSVGLAVYATDGGEISGLKINPVQNGNAPGQNTGSVSTGSPGATQTGTSTSGGGDSNSDGSSNDGSGSSTSTASGSSSSATESGAAFRIDGRTAGGAVAAAAIGVVAFAL